jgi:hypothetical protein
VKGHKVSGALLRHPAKRQRFRAGADADPKPDADEAERDSKIC